MSDVTDSSSFAEDWNVFWQGAQQSDQLSILGAQDKALGVFWNKFFRDELPRHDRPRILDAACGNGAVTEFALQTASSIEGTDAIISAMDYSEAAIAELLKKHPEVNGTSCDASDTPFADGDFHIVASQFGLEYAGDAAFEEAARLVAKDGVLVAIVHMKKGAIYEECNGNLKAIRELKEANLIGLARNAFDVGFAVVAGNAAQSSFREADERLAPAVEALKETLTRHGPQAAGGIIQRLGADLGHMYQRIQSYVPHEVSEWFDGMANEMKAYEGRMQSMVDAALDDADIESLSDQLKSKGLTMDTHDVLRMGVDKKPAAWIVLGRKIS